MSLAGSGFLAIWNDIQPQIEDEYKRWHTQEHVPERASIPGFLQARRYVAQRLDFHRYFTLYEVREPAVLQGAHYVARLNDPTPWTRKMMPGFLNFVRGACVTLASTGGNVGGVLATLRFDRQGTALSADAARAVALKLGDIEGVVAVHLGVADSDITRVPTNERELRKGGPDQIFDGVMMVEATDELQLNRGMASIRSLAEQALPGMAWEPPMVYALAVLRKGTPLDRATCDRIS